MMMKLIPIITLLYALSLHAQDCPLKFKIIPTDSIQEYKGEYFKIISYYTKDSKNEASSNVLYAMILGEELNISSNWDEWSILDKNFDKVSGAASYLAPTFQELKPSMQKFFESKQIKPDQFEKSFARAQDIYDEIADLLAEIMGGNRIRYEHLDDGWSLLNAENPLKMELNPTHHYFYNEQCRNLTKMQKGANRIYYARFDIENKQTIELVKKHRTLLNYIHNNLSSESHFKNKIKNFLLKYKE